MVLRNLDSTHILCGITTNVCVHTIMREANALVWCLLLKDSVGATDVGNHEAAINSVNARRRIWLGVGHGTSTRRSGESRSSVDRNRVQARVVSKTLYETEKPSPNDGFFTVRPWFLHTQRDMSALNLTLPLHTAGLNERSVCVKGEFPDIAVFGSE